MTVTTEPPRTVVPEPPRRRRGWATLAVCGVAALAAVAALVRVLGDESPPAPRDYDAVWFEAPSPDVFEFRVAARRFPHDPVYVDSQTMASAETDNADLARDGRHLAYVTLGNELRVVTLPDADVRVVPVPDDATHPSWSPDLRTVALSSSAYQARSFYLVDVEAGTVRTVRLPDAVRTISYRLHTSWSPDGATLAVNGEDGIHVLRPDGTPVRRLPGYGVSGAHAWSPDGTRLLAYWHQGGPYFHVIDAVTGRKVSEVAFNLYDTAWTPDGGFVHGDAGGMALRYYDAGGRVVRTEPIGYAGSSHSATGLSVRPAS